MRTVAGVLWMVTLLCLAACASRGATSGLQADGSQFDMVVLLHRDLPDGGGRVLYVRNNYTRNSRHPGLEVTSVTLRECHNVQGGCQPRMSMSIVIPFGETRQVLTVLPADSGAPLSFKWGVGGRWLEDALPSPAEPRG